MNIIFFFKKNCPRTHKCVKSTLIFMVILLPKKSLRFGLEINIKSHIAKQNFIKM